MLSLTSGGDPGSKIDSKSKIGVSKIGSKKKKEAKKQKIGSHVSAYIQNFAIYFVSNVSFISQGRYFVCYGVR